MDVEKEERRLFEEFSKYARKYGEIESGEEDTEIIIPKTDEVRFFILGDFVSVSIYKGASPEESAVIGIDCYKITQKLRFTNHTLFEFDDDDD